MNLICMANETNLPNQNVDRARTEGVEIPVEEWQKFLNGFSLKHDGWIANLEVVAAPDGTSVIAVKERPFNGISAELFRNVDSRVVISFNEEDPSEHFAKTIVGPRRILLTGDGDDIVIEAQDGSRTMIRFVQAVNPGKPSGMSDAA
jgi:hypothetical protein